MYVPKLKNGLEEKNEIRDVQPSHFFEIDLIISNISKFLDCKKLLEYSLISKKIYPVFLDTYFIRKYEDIVVPVIEFFSGEIIHSLNEVKEQNLKLLEMNRYDDEADKVKECTKKYLMDSKRTKVFTFPGVNKTLRDIIKLYNPGTRHLEILGLSYQARIILVPRPLKVKIAAFLNLDDFILRSKNDSIILESAIEAFSYNIRNDCDQLEHFNIKKLTLSKSLISKKINISNFFLKIIVPEEINLSNIFLKEMTIEEGAKISEIDLSASEIKTVIIPKNVEIDELNLDYTKELKKLSIDEGVKISKIYLKYSEIETVIIPKAAKINELNAERTECRLQDRYLKKIIINEGAKISIVNLKDSTIETIIISKNTVINELNLCNTMSLKELVIDESAKIGKINLKGSRMKSSREKCLIQ